MFDAIFAFGSLTAGGRGLEVGAGTGKATLAMLARGLRVDAIEPDLEMAAVLRGNVIDAHGGVVENTYDTELYVTRSPGRL